MRWVGKLAVVGLKYGTVAMDYLHFECVLSL